MFLIIYSIWHAICGSVCTLRWLLLTREMNYKVDECITTMYQQYDSIKNRLWDYYNRQKPRFKFLFTIQSTSIERFHSMKLKLDGIMHYVKAIYMRYSNYFKSWIFGTNMEGGVCHCLESEWVYTNCGHLFHSKCLKSWQNHQKSCPTCKVKLD